MFEVLKQPMPWYIGGLVIGLTVPALLISGNKKLGVSSSLRHVCAACFPGNIPYLKYEWRKQAWSLFFAAGIVLGGFVGGYVLKDPQPQHISSQTINRLSKLGVNFNEGFIPNDIFNWKNLFTLQGFIMMVAGGFLVGFGTRYAGGCTSGHSIMGLSNLQLPSLIATICFMVGGFIMANLILPFILML